MNKCVQGKERGQQLLLMHNRENDDWFIPTDLLMCVVRQRERKRETDLSGGWGDARPTATQYCSQFFFSVLFHLTQIQLAIMN